MADPQSEAVERPKNRPSPRPAHMLAFPRESAVDDVLPTLVIHAELLRKIASNRSYTISRHKSRTIFGGSLFRFVALISILCGSCSPAAVLGCIRLTMKHARDAFRRLAHAKDVRADPEGSGNRNEAPKQTPFGDSAQPSSLEGKSASEIAIS